MSLLSALRESPSPLPRSSRFTVWNGVLYMAAGGLLLIWPGAVQSLLQDAEFNGREAELIRVLGMAVVIIGWFYVFGGRSGGRQVVAASVLDRLILVPVVLAPLALGGVFPHLLWTFVVLDPVLALVAWRLLEQEPAGDAAA